MLLLVLKGKQIQTGANWDSVISISVGILLLAGVVLLLALIISRIAQSRRVKRAHHRGRRKAGSKASTSER
jgi:hypothetical protein